MKVTSKVNRVHLEHMHEIFQQAQVQTVDALKTDVQTSQTMPFDSSALQNNKTDKDISNVKKGIASVVSEGPYARRLYFHPEYNFKQDKNPKAGAFWFQPYIDGNKKMLPHILFTKFVKRMMK